MRAGLMHARLGFFRWMIGESQAYIDEIQRAIALIPATPPTVERAEGRRRLCLGADADGSLSRVTRALRGSPDDLAGDRVARG